MKKEQNINLIKQRILQIPDAMQITKKEFCKKICIAPSNLTGDNLNSAPSVDVIIKILTSFEQISVHWLLFGTGEMFCGFSEKALFIEQKSAVERLEETIELQRELIGSLKEQIAMLKKEIADGRDIVVFGKAE